MPLRDLVSILQIAIGPVILISGIGLLLLSMTNRFGRIIDRSRQLTTQFRTATTKEERTRLLQEIDILSRRSRIVRAAITSASLSLLLAAILIIVLFLTALLDLRIVRSIIALFTCCMVSVIVSLFLFLRDINLSLAALKLELGSIGMKTPD